MMDMDFETDYKNWFKFVPYLDIENPEEVLSKKISILDLLDRYGFEYFRAGDTFKVRCPFHGGGMERTPSLTIYENTNTFNCFACSANGNIISFVALQMGYSSTKKDTLGYNNAIVELCNMAGITNEEQIANSNKILRPKPEETVKYHIFNTGIEIREFLRANEDNKNYKKICKWADKQFLKMDYYLEDEEYDWKRAKKYYDLIIGKIKKE